MKLCRFELLESPGHPRTGIFHDNRVYETDGQNAIGVHELSKVRFLAPIGQPPSVRIFDDAAGDLYFAYGNPSSLCGPLSEIDMPPAAVSFEPEIRIAVACKDRGECIEADEASEFVLGYTICVFFRSEALQKEELPRGLPPVRSRDFLSLVGPFLVTPDDFEGAISQRVWKYSLSVGGEICYAAESLQGIPQERMFPLGSQTVPVQPGDLLVGPPLTAPTIDQTNLGRSIRPGDTLQVNIEGLGTLVGHIV